MTFEACRGVDKFYESAFDIGGYVSEVAVEESRLLTQPIMISAPSLHLQSLSSYTPKNVHEEEGPSHGASSIMGRQAQIELVRLAKTDGRQRKTSAVVDSCAQIWSRRNESSS